MNLLTNADLALNTKVSTHAWPPCLLACIDNHEITEATTSVGFDGSCKGDPFRHDYYSNFTRQRRFGRGR